MPQALVFTFVGTDRPGLVETLSRTVSACGGNWLESRMSELAGQFAGIVKVDVAPAQFDALRSALLALSAHQLSVMVAENAGAAAPGEMRALQLNIVGNDRPGILREVSQALAALQVSVREMNTRITSAPMSGEPLFEALAWIQVPQALDLAALRTRLDSVADALTLHIDLEHPKE